MWKPGQLVTLNGKLYRISESPKEEQYRICSLCQIQNMKPPCIERFDYPDKENTFGSMQCVENMPKTCYPRRVNPKR